MELGLRFSSDSRGRIIWVADAHRGDGIPLLKGLLKPPLAPQTIPGQRPSIGYIYQLGQGWAMSFDDSEVVQKYLNPDMAAMVARRAGAKVKFLD